jgi:hypothetical protein
MDLRRSDQLAFTKGFRGQTGFASIAFLAVLPALLAGLLFFLYSQYFLKNWMQSLYTCRTELLETQSRASRELQSLMALNPEAIRLRFELHMAEVELAAAIATENGPAIAAAQAKINRIKQQQVRLDRQQRRIISSAERIMARGLRDVESSLHRQDRWNQQHMPSFFSFKIQSVRSTPKKLAVKPDQPDTAPVYELEHDFTQAQALNVSWTSEFQTKSRESFQWIKNRHKKKQSCTASLKEEGLTYQEVLSEDRPSLRL